MAKKKKVLSILGAIALFVVLAVAFFYPKDSLGCKCLGVKLEASFFAGGGISQCFGVPYSCMQTSPTISTPPPPLESTENWKVYIDEKYGFQLKYPDELTFTKDKGVAIVELSNANETNPRILRILAIEKDINTLIEGLEDNLGHTGYVLLGIEPVSIQGVKEARIVKLGYNVGVPAAYHAYIAKNETETVVLQWFGTNQEIFTQILSAFQFLEQ